MSTLHVRNVPEEIYSQIQKLANERNRSISSEVIHLLDQSLKNENARARSIDLLAGIQNKLFKPPTGTPSSEKLIREDRDR